MGACRHAVGSGALRAALDVPELHPSRPAPLREALASLDRHAVGPEAQDVAGLYWTGRHSEAVSRIWRTPLTAEETAAVQAETDEILHTTVAVQEYLWRGSGSLSGGLRLFVCLMDSGRYWAVVSYLVALLAGPGANLRRLRVAPLHALPLQYVIATC